MNENWMTIEYLLKQEVIARAKTEEFYGKNREGFCDFALDGVELMIQGTGYLRKINIDNLNEKDEFKNFDGAIRAFSFYHYFRVTFTFLATYKLLLYGYYTEAAILLRSIIETFVRLKYLYLRENIELVNQAFAGYRGFKGKKFTINYETQFDKVAPGLYIFYRELCDMAHGALSSTLLKTDWGSSDRPLDSGLLHKDEESTFIANQFSAYLLAHIEFMSVVYPEIQDNQPDQYAEKYHKTLSILWMFMKEVSTKEKNKLWYDAVKNLIKS